MEENISETTSDTARLVSNDEASTSDYTRLNKDDDFQVILSLLWTNNRYFIINQI